MVPKLHAKGCSFRGAAAYLLHDKGGASTAHRLAWTEVKNLATDNPHTAWKVMAATAMDQDRMKAAAGIKNTGRKSKDHVLHLTLSWHPDESEGVTREEMMRAANGAIRALKADHHQALIVAHNDEPQAHIHILLNRVGMDGRILSSSKEKLNLSRWAERYEKERGTILCPERVVNNAARDRGEYVRGEPDQARHLFEQRAANNNVELPAAVAAEQKRKDAVVAKKAREIRMRCRAALRNVDQAHRQRIAGIRAKAKRALEVARQAIHAKFKPERVEKIKRDEAETKSFNEREQHLLGRVQNAWRVAGGKLGKLFNALTHAGERVAGLKRTLAAGDAEIDGRQRRDRRARAAEVRQTKSQALADARALYLKERKTAELTGDMEAATLRAEWKTRREQRAATWRQGKWKSGDTTPIVKVDREMGKGPPEVQPDFTTVALPSEPPTSSGGDEKAAKIEEHLRRMREAREMRKSRKPGRHL